ncbi:hypothetical protein SOASR014_45020 [Pectobacterium carotovorum subsp. carotovorum]|nr:hypothetical protein SOASR014_45020 [Pectobacterium carotovorum subsp. carotovorum]GLX46773.1 hypothetical protein Pcaca01_44410 [Pectobacterium carotovorum subsp. carotovorum]
MFYRRVAVNEAIFGRDFFIIDDSPDRFFGNQNGCADDAEAFRCDYFPQFFWAEAFP